MAASPSDLLATQVEEKEKEWRQLEKERQYRLLTELNEKDAKIQQLQVSTMAAACCLTRLIEKSC